MKIEIMREWNWMRLVCSDVIAPFVGINLQGRRCLTASAEYKWSSPLQLIKWSLNWNNSLHHHRLGEVYNVASNPNYERLLMGCQAIGGLHYASINHHLCMTGSRLSGGWNIIWQSFPFEARFEVRFQCEIESGK